MNQPTYKSTPHFFFCMLFLPPFFSEQLTAGDVRGGSFDWWRGAAVAGGGGPRGGGLDLERQLHGRLLGLRDCAGWLPGLLLNADAARSYPGGPGQCLQVLAFWLSWCRQLYAPGQRLRLCRSLLAALPEWGERLSPGPAGAPAAAAAEVDSVDEAAELPVEVLELRARMAADFGREVRSTFPAP